MLTKEKGFDKINYSFGRVAEWLGKSLQNSLLRFKPGRDLKPHPVPLGRNYLLLIKEKEIMKIFISPGGGMADTRDLKSLDRKIMRVRLSPWALENLIKK